MTQLPISLDQTNTLAADVKGLGAIKSAAKQNSPEAFKSAAKQFEGIFINMLLKSMRATVPTSGLNDSSAQKMYQGMFDQQISQTMAQRGIGLADMMVKQLKARENTIAPDASNLSNTPQAGVSAIASSESPIAKMQKYQQQLAEYAAQHPVSSIGQAMSGGAQGFVQAVADGAQVASQITGIPAAFITAQAALESGWGKHQIINSDGTTSHNLFGIKAGPGWNGKVAKSWTTEVINGVSVKILDNFRAYDSYADSFKDYASLLVKNQRYQKVIANGQTVDGFANSMQTSGYATDPNYGSKLKNIIQNIQAS
jgi:flagellar protein FlgJ